MDNGAKFMIQEGTDKETIKSQEFIDIECIDDFVNQYHDTTDVSDQHIIRKYESIFAHEESRYKPISIFARPMAEVYPHLIGSISRTKGIERRLFDNIEVLPREKLSVLFHPIYYESNGTILLVCPTRNYIVEYNAKENIFYKTVELKEGAFPQSDNYSMAVDLQYDLLFVSTLTEFSIFNLKRDVLQKKICEIKNYIGIKSHCKRFKSTHLLWISCIEEIHLIGDNEHFAYDPQQQAFERMCQLPTIPEQCVYLNGLNTIIFFGGIPHQDDEYGMLMAKESDPHKEIIYAAKVIVNEKKATFSLKLLETDLYMPRTRYAFIAIPVFGHAVIILYRNLREFWFMDFFAGKYGRIWYKEELSLNTDHSTNLILGHCYGVNVCDDVIHLMNGKWSWLQLCFRSHGECTCNNCMKKQIKMNLSDLVIPEISSFYRELVFGYTKLAQREYDLYYNFPDYLSRLILTFFNKYA